jgi:hypothetical protein
MTVGVLCLTLAAGATSADPQTVCSIFRADIPLESSIATAGVWANLRKRADSVRTESKRLLGEAEGRIATAQPPDDLCPASCETPITPQIIFSTLPTEFLQVYEQSDKCERLLQTTSKTPLTFDPLTFDSLDQLNDWVYEFTRGKGAQGQELYRRCDGKCSPQYLWTISRSGEKLTIETEVTCGHARDRDVNRYALASSLRWTCASP